MKNWNIKVKVWQGLHSGGTKFYRGMWVYGETETGEQHGIASMTAWGKANANWQDDLSLGQGKFDQMAGDGLKKGVAQSQWIATELTRKRKDGYDVPFDPAKNLHLVHPWKETNVELHKLFGMNRAETIYTRVIDLNNALAKRGFEYQYGRTAESSKVLSPGVFQAASEQSDGWATW